MRWLVSVRRALVVVCAGVASASADPATQSSLPWLIQGTGAVARSGRTLFFGNTYGAVPRANQARGLAVFSQAEAVGEIVDGASASDVFSAIADGAGGWYVGGDFTAFGGISRRGVAHVLANGRVDPAFTANINSGGVFSMILHGSQLIIAGAFATVNLVPRTGLAWVDAATGQVLPISSTATGLYLALSGNTLFVGYPGVAAVNATTGAAVPGFATTVTGGSVQSLAVEGSSLYLGGNFAQIAGTGRAGIARISAATGLLDPTWNPGVGGAFYDVQALVVASGSLYVGGRFATLAGQPRANLGAVSIASGAATGWRADTDGGVYGLAADAGAIFAGGVFTTIGGEQRLSAAAVNAGATATVLPWNPSLIGLVRGVATGAGRVAVVGSLNNWGVMPRRGLSAVDVVTGELLPWAPDLTFSGNVVQMLVDGPRLIIGGSFASIDGATRTNLAMFDLETRALLPFAPVIDGPVTAVAVANGVLYIGGSFAIVNSAFRINLAAFDLASGQLLAWDPQADAGVSSIIASPGGVIVAGGFTSLIGTNGFRTRIGLGEISSAGVVTAFDSNIAAGTVSALAASGSTLFIGGSFSMVGGIGRSNLAAVTLTDGALLPWNPGTNGFVNRISVSRGNVYLGGAFGTVGGTPRVRVARVSASDGAVSSWQLPFTPSSVSDMAAFDDGLLLNLGIPSSAAQYRENGQFLPEESVAGLPGPPAEPAARVVASALRITFGPPVMGPRPASYLLEAGTGPGLVNIGTIPLVGTEFSIGGVPPGVYYVRARAVGPSGAGAPSRELMFVVGAPTCTMPPTSPAAPTTTATGASIVIDWRASPGSAPTAFTLLAGTSAGFANIATLSQGSGTTFATAGVPAGAYFVRVIAANACGQSAASADGVLRVGGAAGPPGAPLQFTGTAAAGVVSLSWHTSTGGVPTGHQLEAGTGPTLRNLAIVTLGAGFAFSTGGVPPGTYYLRVRAVNASGISPPSGELILVIP